jgi:hypothetical protein
LALKEIINPSWAKLWHIYTCVYYCKIFVITSLKLHKYLQAVVISFIPMSILSYSLIFSLGHMLTHCSLKSSSMERVSAQLSGP